eukprot:jgi/Mesvir1/29198/Mv16249-RA.1
MNWLRPLAVALAFLSGHVTGGRRPLAAAGSAPEPLLPERPLQHPVVPAPAVRVPSLPPLSSLLSPESTDMSRWAEGLLRDDPQWGSLVPTGKAVRATEELGSSSAARRREAKEGGGQGQALLGIGTGGMRRRLRGIYLEGSASSGPLAPSAPFSLPAPPAPAPVPLEPMEVVVSFQSNGGGEIHAGRTARIVVSLATKNARMGHQLALKILFADPDYASLTSPRATDEPPCQGFRVLRADSLSAACQPANYTGCSLACTVAVGRGQGEVLVDVDLAGSQVASQLMLSAEVGTEDGFESALVTVDRVIKGGSGESLGRVAIIDPMKPVMLSDAHSFTAAEDPSAPPGAPRSLLVTATGTLQFAVLFGAPVRCTTQGMVDTYGTANVRQVAAYEVTVGGASISFVAQPTSQGVVVLQVTAGACSDLTTGAASVASEPFVFLFDSEPPRAAIHARSPRLTRNATIDYVIQFQEVVTGFSPSSLSVSNAAIVRFSSAGAAVGRYELTVRAETEDFVGVSLKAGAATDLAGRPCDGASSVQLLHYREGTKKDVIEVAAIAGMFAALGLSVISTALGASKAAGGLGHIALMLGHFQLLQMMNGLYLPTDADLMEATHGVRFLSLLFPFPFVDQLNGAPEERAARHPWLPPAGGDCVCLEDARRRRVAAGDHESDAWDEGSGRGRPGAAGARAPPDQCSSALPGISCGLYPDVCRVECLSRRLHLVGWKEATRSEFFMAPSELEDFKGPGDFVSVVLSAATIMLALALIHLLVVYTWPSLHAAWPAKFADKHPPSLAFPGLGLLGLMFTSPAVARACAFYMTSGSTQGAAIGAIVLVVYPLAFFLAACYLVVARVLAAGACLYVVKVEAPRAQRWSDTSADAGPDETRSLAAPPGKADAKASADDPNAPYDDDFQFGTVIRATSAKKAPAVSMGFMARRGYLRSKWRRTPEGVWMPQSFPPGNDEIVDRYGLLFAHLMGPKFMRRMPPGSSFPAWGPSGAEPGTAGSANPSTDGLTSKAPNSPMPGDLADSSGAHGAAHNNSSNDNDNNNSRNDDTKEGGIARQGSGAMNYGFVQYGDCGSMHVRTFQYDHLRKWRTTYYGRMQAVYMLAAIAKQLVFAVALGVRVKPEDAEQAGQIKVYLLTAWILLHMSYIFVVQPFVNRVAGAFELFSVGCELGVVVSGVMLLVGKANSHVDYRKNVSTAMLGLSAACIGAHLAAHCYNLRKRIWARVKCVLAFISHWLVLAADSLFGAEPELHTHAHTRVDVSSPGATQSPAYAEWRAGNQPDTPGGDLDSALGRDHAGRYLHRNQEDEIEEYVTGKGPRDVSLEVTSGERAIVELTPVHDMRAGPGNASGQSLGGAALRLPGGLDSSGRARGPQRKSTSSMPAGVRQLATVSPNRRAPVSLEAGTRDPGRSSVQLDQRETMVSALRRTASKKGPADGGDKGKALAGPDDAGGVESPSGIQLEHDKSSKSMARRGATRVASALGTGDTGVAEASPAGTPRKEFAVPAEYAPRQALRRMSTKQRPAWALPSAAGSASSRRLVGDGEPVAASPHADSTIKQVLQRNATLVARRTSDDAELPDS